MKGERFRGKMFTFRKYFSKKESPSYGDKKRWEEKRDLVCFKCKKLRHIKYDCPLYKSEDESSEEENEKEVENMCFMAIR